MTTSTNTWIAIGYVAVPMIIACCGSLMVAIAVDRRDGKKRRDQGLPPKSQVDRVVKNSIRMTFILGAFIATLSLSLTPPDMFTVTTNDNTTSSAINGFTWHTLLRLDTTAVKNMLHGCFLLGGYTNWIMTGNYRYATIITSVLLFMIPPAIVATIINIVQVYYFGSQCVMAMLTSLAFVVITLMCLGVVDEAHRRAQIDTSTDYPNLSKHTLSTAGMAMVDSMLGVERAPSFKRLLSSLRGLIKFEAALFVVFNMAVLVYRLPLATQAPLPYSVFVAGFISAYTMGIHLGWLTGNGWNAVRACSLESFNLFMWAKFVFASLTIIETIGMIATSSSSFTNTMNDHDDAMAVPVPVYNNGVLTNDIWWSHVWLSIIYLAISGLCQLWSFITIRRLQNTLWTIGYRNDEQFVAIGTSAAAVGESSVFTLGRNLLLPREVRQRAFRAAISALASLAVFAVECGALAWMVPTMSGVFPAFNFALHVSAIFMLTYYRSAQDYTARLRRQSLSLQSACFMVYALVSATQLLSLYIGSNGDVTATVHHRNALVFSIIRCVVNGIAAICFAQLRYKSDELPSPAIATAASASPATPLSTTTPSDHQESKALELASLNNSSESNTKDEMIVTSSRTAVIGIPIRRTAIPALPVPIGANTTNAVTARLAHDDHDGREDEQANLLSSSSSSSSSSNPSVLPSSSISTVFDINQVAHQLDLSDRRIVTWTWLTVQAYWLAFAAVAIAMTIDDARSHVDMTGLVGAHTPADITPESHAYHIGFHFLFLLMGYTVRGYRAANQMFLNFASLTTSLVVLVLLSALISRIVNGNGVPSMSAWHDIMWSLVWIMLAMALAANIVMMQRLVGVVRRSPHLFPQHSHAMV